MITAFMNTFSWRTLTILGVVCFLSACASAPNHHSRIKEPTQPLTRMNLAVPPQDQDLLLKLMAGEFALNQGDLETAGTLYLEAAQLSSDPAIAEQATSIAMVNKLWARAHQALARWETLQPEAVGVSQTHAALALIEGKPEAAYPDLFLLTQLPDGRGWPLIGQALLISPDKAVAATLLERLAQPKQLGDKSAVWIAVSQLAFKLEQKTLARSLAEQALDKFKTSDIYIWLAQLAIDASDKARAKTLFADALKRDEKNTRLRLAYATLLSDQGDNIAAANVLAQGIQDDFTYAARAAYLARANDKPLLATLYRELQKAPEPHPAARLNLLGQLAELLEHKSEAMQWYKQIREGEEHWFEAQMRIVILIDETGDSTSAVTLMHELQARAGDDTEILGEIFLLEAELLRRHERSKEALEVYERGLKSSPNDTRLLYARALLQETLDNFEAAERDLRRVIELKPDNADALNALGYTLADHNKNLTEAKELIEKAIKLKPDESAILDSLGWIHYRLGNLEEALKYLQRAYKKQPEAEIAAHLGEVLWVSGQKDEASKIWEEAKKKEGKNKTLEETIKRFTK